MIDPQSVSPARGAPPPPDDEAPEPPALRRLRLLVSLLMAVLILGTITVSGALVMRLGMIGPGAAPEPAAGAGGAAAVAPPAMDPVAVAAEALALPEGERVVAVGRAGPELLLVTEDASGTERLRGYDAATGAARSVTRLERGPAGTD
ncbi:hypothetical protein LNKW23_10280 [Paralimibaculum aggregatum]|uniref:Uncharacterized protein n=1 Tax=Paralimibaculum aggregatum TaxID=3036245 RepID=A0ABQ6LHX2_9RHOB|nr:DUF6476 family protein [Limibaculum sp. NKW23]GMG81815.1 hypothetical protein LNKW23_10280 [Limibaculum sp. NKW23]